MRKICCMFETNSAKAEVEDGNPPLKDFFFGDLVEVKVKKLPVTKKMMGDIRQLAQGLAIDTVRNAMIVKLPEGSGTSKIVDSLLPNFLRFAHRNPNVRVNGIRANASLFGIGFEADLAAALFRKFFANGNERGIGSVLFGATRRKAHAHFRGADH